MALRKKALQRAKISPNAKLIMNKYIKEPVILKVVKIVNGSPVSAHPLIILYRTMQTASFTTPSPKRTENNLGSLFSFTKVSAQTESVALITAEKKRISFKVRCSIVGGASLFFKYAGL